MVAQFDATHTHGTNTGSFGHYIRLQTATLAQLSNPASDTLCLFVCDFGPMLSKCWVSQNPYAVYRNIGWLPLLKRHQDEVPVLVYRQLVPKRSLRLRRQEALPVDLYPSAVTKEDGQAATII